MKLLSTLILLITLVAGCSKKEDVDPRDQYVGTYSISYTSVYKTIGTTNPTTSTDSGRDFLIIKKGTASNELTFIDNDTYTAKLSGSGFTVAPYTSSVKASDGTTLAFRVTATGSFNGKVISYTENLTGNNLIITSTVSGSK